MDKNNKEYGLIIPGKSKMLIQTPGKRAAIFDEESDSEDSEMAKPNFSKPKPERKKPMLEEDPTVYQYDEVYDEMEKKKNDTKLARKDLEKKPKYISNLLKAAERRKRENELRIERQVAKEREAEGDEFKDKESYVTPSYVKKLEEMKALEEKERYEEYLESVGDVRKQGNLDGFYRHLYDQKVNYEDVKKENDEKVEPEPEKVSNKVKKSRQYRAREKAESDEEVEEIKKEHMPSNLDADSDFSIDSSDSEDEKSEEITSKNESELIEVKKEADTEEKEHRVEETEGEKPQVELVETKPVVKKPKIDIWKKRTVGEAFEDARKRYFERVAARETG